MNIKRQRQLAAKKEFKKPVTEFEQIDLSTAEYVPPGMTQAFRNTRYTVMVYDDQTAATGMIKWPCTRVMIQKHNNTPLVNHWSEIQKIKNELFGEETVAVEFYPSESKLINDFNIYWIWLFPDGVLPIPEL